MLIDDSYQWPDGKKSAMCFSVDVDAHAPWFWNNRQGLPKRLSHLEQRRFGPRVGIYRILDLLERYGIKGSFYVPGKVAEDYPELLPALAGNGHEVGLHGYFHELVTEVSDDEFTVALEQSLEIFEKQLGRRPAGFRSPAWEMTPYMVSEIRRCGLYDTSLMGYDHPYTVDGVAEVPVQWITDDAIYFKFMGGGGEYWPPNPPGPLVDGWIDEWRALHRFGTMFMLTVHDWISGHGQRIVMLEKLLDRICAEPSVWIATVGEVAAHHLATQADRFVVSAEIPPEIHDHPARRGA